MNSKKNRLLPKYSYLDAERYQDVARGYPFRGVLLLRVPGLGAILRLTYRNLYVFSRSLLSPDTADGTSALLVKKGEFHLYVNRRSAPCGPGDYNFSGLTTEP